PAVVSPAKKKVVKEDNPRPRKKARKEAPAEASEEAAAEASEEATAEAREEVTTTVRVDVLFIIFIIDGCTCGCALLMGLVDVLEGFHHFLHKVITKLLDIKLKQTPLWI
ncbi:unnamed protein product, partial [Brassica oleracea var. botrytis]